MCGRFTNGSGPDDIGEFFGVVQISEGLPLPSWNVSPTDAVNIVIESVKGDEGPVRRLAAARWALVRPSAPDLKSGPPLFNVRSETVMQKFGWAMRRRALIPLESYYEWQTEGNVKTPFNIHPSGGGFLAAAAVSSWWKDPAVADGEAERWLLTTSMLTMDAVPHLAAIHGRNPVFLPREFWTDWLDPAVIAGEDLVKAAVGVGAEVAAELQFHQVRPLKGNDPSLVEPV